MSQENFLILLIVCSDYVITFCLQKVEHAIAGSFLLFSKCCSMFMLLN